MASTQQTTFDTKQPVFGQNQFLRDYAFAIRHLKQGETEEQVTKSIANFRKDMQASNAVDYAKRTVDKASTAIAHENAIAESLSQQESIEIDAELLKVLDNHVEELTTQEYARRLYASGMDTNTIQILEQHRGLTTEEAVDVANKAAAQVHAEKDTEYAVNQLRREKNPEEIAGAISQYRAIAVKDPEQYGKDVVKIAQQVLEVESDIPTKSLVDARVRSSAQKFKRDVAYAYEHVSKNGDEKQLLLDIQQRNPNAALNTFNYQILGKTDHSYTLAVLSQAQALQNVMRQGNFSLSTALVVVQNDYIKDLNKAVDERRFGIPRADAIGRISEGDNVKQRYAQAVVNNAEHIVNEERNISVRPELTHELSQAYRRQDSVEQAKFHSPKTELDHKLKTEPDLTDQRKALNIPADAKINIANKNDGVYYGKIISETPDKFIQQTGPKTVVAHSKLDVGSDVMKVGTTYNVRYDDGKGSAVIKEYSKQQREQNKGAAKGR